MSDDVDPMIGATLADRYRIVAKIGQGGAGHVYRAIQLQLEREVAIKLVRPDVPERARSELEARFFREAALAGRLSHPSVVQTIDYGTAKDGRQFVVMELLRGRTLKRALKTEMAPEEAARMGAALARGLHHAHAKGLVHRDVKSANVFLVKDEEGVEHPKLLDFGLVKSVRRELDITQTPTYLGTPLYMSPEQARGEMNIDARSDIYSLGCLLYRMLTGEMPFRGESAMATAFMHVSEPYPPMGEKVPGLDIDPDLEAIVRRSMAKEPADRWQEASALAQALDAWRAEQSRPAPPPPPPQGGMFSAVMGAVGVLGFLGLLVGGIAALASIAAIAVIFLLPNGPPVEVAAPDDAVAEVAPDEPPGEHEAVAGDTDVDAGDTDPDTTTTADEAPRTAQGRAEETPASSPPPRPAPSVPSGGSVPTRNVGEDGSATDRGGSPPVVDPVVPVEPVSAPTRPASGGWEPLTVDRYTFRTQRHAEAALLFANTATKDELTAAKVSNYTVDTVIRNRPYADLQAFGATKGIGPSTVYAIATETRP